MKKLVCIVLSLVLAFSTTAIVMAQSEDSNSGYGAENGLKSPILESYSVDKDDIKKGDNVNFFLTIVDPNINKSSAITGEYIKQFQLSGFDFNSSSASFENGGYITYSDESKGGIVSLNLKTATYSGDGHKLSLTYGFNLSGKL